MLQTICDSSAGNRPDLSEENQGELAFFLALLFTRGPSFRDSINNLHGELLTKQMLEMDRKDLFPKSPEILQKMIEEKGIENVIHAQIHPFVSLEAMIEGARLIALSMLKKKWIFYRAKDNIYFHCAKTGHKLDNIHYCSNVSFNVVTDVFVVPLIPKEDFDITELKFNGFDTNFKSVVIFGEAKEVFGEEKIESLRILFEKFLNVNDFNQYKEAGIQYIEKSVNRTKVIKIEIVHMTGKRGIK